MGLSFWHWPQGTYRSRIPRSNLENTLARLRNWNGFGRTSLESTVEPSSETRLIRSLFIPVIACPLQRIFEGSVEYFKSKSAELFACISESEKFKDRPSIRIGNTELAALTRDSLSESMPSSPLTRMKAAPSSMV